MLYSQVTWLCVPVYNYFCPVHLICRSPGNQQRYNGGIYFIFSHSVVNLLLDISSYTYCSLSYNRSIASSKNQVLYRVQSSASSFNTQYPLISFTSSSSCLHLPRLLVTSVLPSIFPSACCRRQFLCRMRPTRLAFL